MAARERLDRLLVERGLVTSRAKAQELINAGLVTCDGQVARKPARLVNPESDVQVTGEVHPWVSRGGMKLAGALEHFEIDPAGMVCLDIGASTGGFTDVLLTKGAARVHAVDSGHGQLAGRIAADPRVVDLSGHDARELPDALFAEPIDLVVCDVSFISLTKAVPRALDLVRPGGRFVGLVKPQFEVGPGKVGKGGIVRDPDLLEQVHARTHAWFAERPGWTVIGWMESPIEGGDGNREFLLAAEKV